MDLAKVMPIYNEVARRLALIEKTDEINSVLEAASVKAWLRDMIWSSWPTDRNDPAFQRRLAVKLTSVPHERVVALGYLVDYPLRIGGDDESEPTSGTTKPNGDARVDGDGPIFVVHGRNHERLHEAVRVLERGTGRDVVVLHEKPNSGRTILEKFEHHAAAAAYAVVLLTSDDQGGVVGGNTKARARQNVIFELGFFFGVLGRQRVAVLTENDVERPSDIDGLVYIDLDAAGAWKRELARELAAAGIDVDDSRIP